MSVFNKLMKTCLKATGFKRFLKDNSGSITQILGMSALPVFLASGAAIDMARINNEQTAFHAAVDSATLAVAADERSALGGLSEGQLAARKEELKQFAKKYLEANYQSQSGSPSSINVNLDITGQAIKLTAEIQFPTTIMSLAGIDTLSLNESSTVKKAMRPIEMVMVMDTTGSMASSGKMDAAKDAARQLMNTLYSGSATAEPRSEFIRVGLVPFAGAVRLDTTHSDFKLDWIDTTGANPLSKLNFDAIATPTAWNNYYAWSRVKRTSSTFHTWNGCVEARMRGTAGAGTDYNANDAEPVSAATKFPAYFAYDAPGTSSSTTSTSYGYNYIQTSGTPNEYTGLTSAIQTSYTTTDLLKKQENYAKYDGRVIGNETVGSSGPWAGCAVSKIVPMTYDRAAIETGITAMTASGPTMIGEGLSWGLRAISPTEPFTKVQGSGSLAGDVISPFNGPRWRKTVVLMTDGDNDLGAGSYGYNTTTYSAFGRGGENITNNRFGTTSSSAIMTALDNDMLTVCTKIKAAGIDLYVTSFGSGVSTATRNRLKSCASSDANYTHATTSADLVAFFDHIGEDVLNKSIYVSK